MKEFFRGWRRKLGCVTLVIALGLFVGQIRSEMYSDSFSFQIRAHCRYAIESENGYLFWETTPVSPSSAAYGPYWRTLYSCDPNLCAMYYRDESVGWRFLFFALGRHEVVPRDIEVPDVIRSMPRQTWFMSYWTAIAPLTAISAYLILRRPRKMVDARAPRAAQRVSGSGDISG